MLVRAIASEYRVVTVTHDVTHSALDCDSTSRHKQTSEAQTGPRSFHETVTKSPTCFLTFAQNKSTLHRGRLGDGARARDASEKRGGAAGRLAAFARFTSDGARDDPNGTSGGDPAAALRSISPSVLNSFY